MNRWSQNLGTDRLHLSVPRVHEQVDHANDFDVLFAKNHQFDCRADVIFKF